MKPCKVCGDQFETPKSPNGRRREICDKCRAQVDPHGFMLKPWIDENRRRKEVRDARERMQRIAVLSSA